MCADVRSATIYLCCLNRCRIAEPSTLSYSKHCLKIGGLNLTNWFWIGYTSLRICPIQLMSAITALSSCIHRTKILGRGASGEVRLAYWRGATVAVKVGSGFWLLLSISDPAHN